jgi:8-oxo-dGTP pyrophosphatase MutT (NUDIX family)
MTLDEFAAAIAPHLVADPADAWSRPPAGDVGLLAGGTRLRDAAVLFGVVPRPGDSRLILTTRTTELRAHAGQIALPGGTVDPTDRDPIATALREAEEEIGLPPGLVTPLGYFRPYVAGTGYRIMPVVAAVAPGFVPVANAREVADVFEVPLGFLLDAGNHRIGRRFLQGRDRRFYEMPYSEPAGPEKPARERYIWGITAGIIRQVAEHIGGA